MFRQRELFNILVSKSRLIHRGICNRGKLRREFDTGEIVVVRKKVNSIRNNDISQKLVLKKRDSIEFCKRLHQDRIGFSIFLLVRLWGGP